MQAETKKIFKFFHLKDNNLNNVKPSDFKKIAWF